MKLYFCGSTNEIEKLVADLIFHHRGISRAPVWTVLLLIILVSCG